MTGERRDPAQVTIKPAKGRPMLQWVGKRPLKPKVTDWRAMVDCVMIDPAYDGAVFNVALSDIPEKKTDFVQGTYELDPPKGKHTTVAVKIVAMLGEEVVVTRDV